MSDERELEVIRRAQSGDAAAFEELVDAYQGVLYNLALRMTGNREDARDLTQTVFLKVWRRIADYDSKYRFYSWVYRITLNESLNWVTRRRRHEELSPLLPASDTTPDDAVHEMEVRSHIQDGLMQLTVEYRQVIVLRHFHDLSYQEIGDMLGVPEKTVKSRLYSARQQLGEMLRRRGVTA